ncbi:MAG: hypothetical protein AAF984_09740 [Verrucomicrobiota bacterium]
MEFKETLDTMVVTSSYVTSDRMPILYVSYEIDEEEGGIWQFHCGNDDYSEDKIQLVSLNTIIGIDQSVKSVADLKNGYGARRKSVQDPWIRFQEN